MCGSFLAAAGWLCGEVSVVCEWAGVIAGTCRSSGLEPVALLTGTKHVSIHRGLGQEDSEGPAVCGENGEPDEGAGVQVQAGGRES